MDHSSRDNDSQTILTPAYLLDESVLLAQIQLLSSHLPTSCEISYPLKTQSFAGVLKSLSSHVAGFSASSLFEAKLARAIGGEKKQIHLTTPTLQDREITELSSLINRVAFNSLSQFNRFGKKFAEQGTSIGLRINPQASFVPDERYNPCRKASKLGIPISDCVNLIDKGRLSFAGVDGILFHNNCESTDFAQLFKTAEKVVSSLSEWLGGLRWINLGGGYLFNEETDFKFLKRTFDLFEQHTDADLIIEPGKGIVGSSMSLVSTIVDLFERDGKKIAVLDTSVNHLPEVFEYQTIPMVRNTSDEGEHVYQLVGSTCLAGDLFGSYRFIEPLHLGSKIVFDEVGAYSFVKAHYFNGVNLPSMYRVASEGQYDLIKQYSYEDFVKRVGDDL